MALGWGTRRKLIYSVASVFVAAAVLWLGYQAFFTAAPTCFDGVQNRDESGVDCGGGYCSLVCAAEARTPIVKWARSFETSPGLYTAAAYVTNPNVGAGAKQVRYSFQLFDDKNLLVAERQGTVNLPPVQTVPIIETNISVGNRTVSRTFFAFSDMPVWNKVRADAYPSLSIAEQNLSADGTRLSAVIINDTVKDARNVTVAAVLFDSEGVARAASRSQFGLIGRKSSQQAVFTWSAPTVGLSRAEITLLPSF